MTGEESASQVRGRAERVGAVVDGLGLVATTELATAIGAIESVSPALAVVDSVQTMASAELTGPAGSVGQVREVATRLAEVAKAGRTCVALVGHVTKEGTVAGPRTLEHLVDAVIYLEGERLGSTRLIRAAKNRFGSTDEVGVLEMRGDGLVEVADASRFFLESEQPPVAGSAVTIALEGTRPLAVEIQALVAPSGAGLAASRHHGDRRQPGADADRGAGAPRRREPHRPRRLRQRGGRPAHRGAGRRPGRGGGARLQPARAAGAQRDRAGRRAVPGRTVAGRQPRRAAPGRGAAAWGSIASSPAPRGRTDAGRAKRSGNGRGRALGAALRTRRGLSDGRCPRSPPVLRWHAARERVATNRFIGFIRFIPVACSIHFGLIGS